MTSNDNQQYMTVELFDAKMAAFMAEIKLGNEQLRNELNAKIDEKFGQLHAEIQVVASQTQVNAAKLEMLQHTFYWGFAILAFIAAFVPLFRYEREKKEQAKEQAVSRDTVLEMVNDAVAVSMRNASIVGK